MGEHLSASKRLRWLRGLGCMVTHTRKGHLKIRTQDGRVIFASSTPSDWRANAKLEAQIRDGRTGGGSRGQ